jgi:hypothetical protein
VVEAAAIIAKGDGVSCFVQGYPTRDDSICRSRHFSDFRQKRTAANPIAQALRLDLPARLKQVIETL